MPSRARTVRRPTRPNTALVRQTLDRLAELDAAWAPRFVGLDGDHEVLTWLPGRTVEHWSARPDLLDELAGTVRQLHDATGDLASGAECLVHDDLQPRNVVVDGRRVGVIDWEQLRPGRRVEDVAQLCWSFAVGPPVCDVVEVGRRWRRIVDAYGPLATADVVPAAIEKIRRCIDDIEQGAGCGSERHRHFMARGDHRDLDRLLRWIDVNGDALADAIA